MRTKSKHDTTSPSVVRALIAIALGSPAGAQVTSRVSVASGGGQANGSSSTPPSISPDARYVAFASTATNLVGGDTNGGMDVFIRDRVLDTTERVSVATGGTQADGVSYAPAVSADGRHVAFQSFATNLVGGDTNGAYDIFVRDRQSGTTERVSVSTSGAQAGMRSDLPAISADGRYVAFMSRSSTLVSGDVGGFSDIFVRDRQTGTTQFVSIATSGAQGNNNSFNPSISADGRYVAFYSLANNLDTLNTDLEIDVFVRDRTNGTTAQVSLPTGGTFGNGPSYNPSVSADGRFVAFQSFATNLVGGDTNGWADIFVRDRQLGATDRVSISTGGAQADNWSDRPSISADGRHVAFWSLATNLFSADTNGVRDVFVHDRQLGTTELASVDTSGTNANEQSADPIISPDGRFVAFNSDASDLVGGDTNATSDTFLRDRDATGFTSLCDPGMNGVIACPCANPPAGTGRGCNNFGAGPVDSGTLTASGAAYLSMDTLVLTATGENNTSLSVFWGGQATLPGGAASGAGVRCVQTNLKRYYIGSASAGSVARPDLFDPSISTRAATLGVPISAGQTRYFYVTYRDPGAAAPCGSTSSTINLTNAGAILWNP